MSAGSLKCGVCLEPTDALFLVANGNGDRMINCCRKCKALSPAQKYALMQEKIDEVIAAATAKGEQAESQGNRSTAERMGKVVASMEKLKRELWRPPGC